jgi:hypothetical protein
LTAAAAQDERNFTDLFATETIKIINSVRQQSLSAATAAEQISCVNIQTRSICVRVRLIESTTRRITQIIREKCSHFTLVEILRSF